MTTATSEIKVPCEVCPLVPGEMRNEVNSDPSEKCNILVEKAATYTLTMALRDGVTETIERTSVLNCPKAEIIEDLEQQIRKDS